MDGYDIFLSICQLLITVFFCFILSYGFFSFYMWLYTVKGYRLFKSKKSRKDDSGRKDD